MASSNKNMHKDQMTHGMRSLTGSLRMSVEPGGEPFLRLCQNQIAENLQNTLRLCGFSPVVATFTTQDGHTKPTTIATFSVQKKTPEKNGAT
jgi:hypothetical protein